MNLKFIHVIDSPILVKRIVVTEGKGGTTIYNEPLNFGPVFGVDNILWRMTKLMRGV